MPTARLPSSIDTAPGLDGTSLFGKGDSGEWRTSSGHYDISLATPAGGTPVSEERVIDAGSAFIRNRKKSESTRLGRIPSGIFPDGESSAYAPGTARVGTGALVARDGTPAAARVANAAAATIRERPSGRFGLLGRIASKVAGVLSSEARRSPVAKGTVAATAAVAKAFSSAAERSPVVKRAKSVAEGVRGAVDAVAMVAVDPWYEKAGDAALLAASRASVAIAGAPSAAKAAFSYANRAPLPVVAKDVRAVVETVAVRAANLRDAALSGAAGAVPSAVRAAVAHVGGMARDLDRASVAATVREVDAAHRSSIDRFTVAQDRPASVQQAAKKESWFRRNLPTMAALGDLLTAGQDRSAKKTVSSAPATGEAALRHATDTNRRAARAIMDAEGASFAMRHAEALVRKAGEKLPSLRATLADVAAVSHDPVVVAGRTREGAELSTVNRSMLTVFEDRKGLRFFNPVSIVTRRQNPFWLERQSQDARRAFRDLVSSVGRATYRNDGPVRTARSDSVDTELELYAGGFKSGNSDRADRSDSEVLRVSARMAKDGIQNLDVVESFARAVAHYAGIAGRPDILQEAFGTAKDLHAVWTGMNRGDRIQTFVDLAANLAALADPAADPLPEAWPPRDFSRR